VFPLEQIAADAGDRGTWQTDLDGVPITFDVLRDPTVVVPRWPAEAGQVDVVYSFYFAWYALQETLTR
jgi:hypothetical protein